MRTDIIRPIRLLTLRTVFSAYYYLLQQIPSNMHGQSKKRVVELKFEKLKCMKNATLSVIPKSMCHHILFLSFIYTPVYLLIINIITQNPCGSVRTYPITSQYNQGFSTKIVNKRCNFPGTIKFVIFII